VQLAREGYMLALTGRREDRLKEVSEAVRNLGGKPLTLAGDVSDAALVKRHHAAIMERFGGLDWAVLNAGVSKSGDAKERFAADDYRFVYGVNVFGMVNWIEAVLPGMLKEKSGTIVGVASVAGYRGLPRSGPYSSSKAAAIALLESLRVDLRGTGVRVVTVCPGFVRTEMTAKWKDEDMPFLMEPADAVRAMIKGIKAGRRVVDFPWPFSTAVKYVARNLPGCIYDRVVSLGTKRRPK
jgi:short-subunit dehydrogenase